MTAQGTYTTIDDRPAVRFERRIAQSVETVWRAVTEPAELAHWFPCTVEIDGLRPGAPMRFAFAPDQILDGEVLELAPPHRFAFTWGADRVEIDLDRDGEGTVLTFVHVLYEEGVDAAAKTMAGWHVCLDALEQALAGTPVTAAGDGPSPAWRAHYDAYVAAGVPSGAAIPGS